MENEAVDTLAALDVGSNSIKLLVARAKSGGGFEVVAEESQVTSLAQGLAQGGELATTRMDTSAACLKRLVDQAHQLGAKQIIAAGTSALRDAGNAAEFIERVRRETGVRINVLSGADEARVSRAAALDELTAAERAHLLFFDVGGGSTELTVVEADAVVASASLQLGARRCTDAAGVGQSVTQEAAAQLNALLDQAVTQAPPVKQSTGLKVAGLGGTATSAVRMLAKPGEKVQVHRVCVTAAQIEELMRRIAPLSLAELEAWPNLDPARAPVIYAGLGIILALLRHYGADSFVVIDRGLRYGLLLTLTGALPAL